MEKRYGTIDNGSHQLPGYSLDEVVDLANQAFAEEGSIDDTIGDLAIAPKIMVDMAEEIRSLRTQLESHRNRP